ncbi:MAG: hypothetical protein FWF67_02465, partial [Fibromonadales bacterium]|nr:hypothetical protein [Fibromonadales bacterium]
QAELQAERIAAQYADSIKIAMRQADSIRKAELDSVKRYYNSIKNTQPKAQKASTQIEKPVPQKSPSKSSNKSIHWSGPNDVIGQAMFEKLEPAGIKKTKCSHSGIVVKLNKPNCKNDDLARITCTYSPIMTITDCDNNSYDVFRTNENFKSSPQTDENSAKEEIASELRSLNFKDWVSEIKKF